MKFCGIQKTNNAMGQDVESAQRRQTFAPRCDIHETHEGIVLYADMPGVDGSSVDIQLEHGVLTVTGKVSPRPTGGLSLDWHEYRVGDFERSFTLSEEIDTGKIEARIKDGVLRVHLPKVEAAKPRKIAVRTD